MSDWLTLQTLIAFALGVMLSAMIKGFVSQARAKIA